MSFISLSTMLSAGLSAAAEGDWETVVSSPISIKNRSVVGTPLKEVWAEGEVNAPLIDVQDALMNVGRLKTYMPYMKESRVLKEQPEDQSVLIYTLIDLPIVGKRDYVTQLWQRQAVRPDGTGALEIIWVARPDYMPARSGIIRLQTNNGLWLGTSTGGAKTWLVYKFEIDPGGWIPAFAANLGNQKGVVDTFKNLEAEALKRMKERLAAAEAAAALATPIVAPIVAPGSAALAPGPR